MEAIKCRITAGPLRSTDPLINAALHVDRKVSTTDSHFEQSHKEAVLDLQCVFVKYRHAAGSKRLRAAAKSVIFSCKPRNNLTVFSVSAATGTQGSTSNIRG